MEPEEMAVARKWLRKHLSAAMDIYTAIEGLLEVVFSVWSVLRLYDEGHQEKLVSHG
jgi:hypothetical protein